MSPDSKTKLLERIKSCFKAASEAEASQRRREKEDLEFQIPENQWDPEARKYRSGTVTSPGRPMLAISLLAQPMALIQNQAATAHLGVEVHPVSETADKEVAEVKQGLYRRIERDSDAQQARLWALDRAKQCGRGWYRVNTQWDEDGDDPFDQEIVIERILYQESVYMDPSAQKADFSDAQWCVVATWVPIETFRADYPKASVPRNDDEFRAWAGEDPNWVTSSGDTKAVLVVEYWWKERVADGEATERPTDKLKRQKERTVVRWALATAKEVLEQADWMGQYIPIIGVVGIELQPFNGERVFEGMVRKARDAQKYFNFAISNEVEAMAQEPKTPWIGAEGFTQGHEDEWELSNVQNRPTLEYKPTSYQGQLNPAPVRAQIDTSRMSLSHQAAMSARELVQMATNVYAPSLGETPKDKTSQSGRAILALQQQSDAGTSHFLNNLAKAMQYEARVVLDLMPKVYDRPGRVVQVLGEEDEPRHVMLNQPFVSGEDGKPQPIQMRPGANGTFEMDPSTKVYDLSRGKYTVSTSVGKSFQTRLQEGAQEIGQILQAAPQLMPILGATYFRFRDFPGAKEIADILKKVRDQQLPGLDANEDGKPTVEQLQAQLQQMQQAGQMQQQQLQMAVKQIETDQAKQQATIVKAQLDAQTAQMKAQADNETKLRISAADNETKLAIAGLIEQNKLILETLGLQREAMVAQREAEQAEAQREHETVENDAERASEHEMAARQAEHADSQAERQREHEDEQGVRQMRHEAAMNQLQQPEPEQPEAPAGE